MNRIGKTPIKDKAPLLSWDHILEEKEEKGRSENQAPPKEGPRSRSAGPRGAPRRARPGGSEAAPRPPEATGRAAGAAALCPPAPLGPLAERDERDSSPRPCTNPSPASRG